MKIKLMTDAPRHNLALMKIATFHKERGDDVFLGKPSDPCDLSYGSWLYNELYPTDISGGVGTDHKGQRLPAEIATCKPDYSLFNLDYSLGYTWGYCPRHCEFCSVWDTNPERIHYSIHDFHDPKFSKICLLNNNTFSDPQWRETFEEIWDADLTVIDENGYDLRHLDDEKLEYLNKTKFDNKLHFAFDRIDDIDQIERGLKILTGIKHHCLIYVLIGFPELRPLDKSDFERCEIIKAHGFDPYIMVYNKIGNSINPKMRNLTRFQRMVNGTYIWRKLGFQSAWNQYR